MSDQNSVVQAIVEEMTYMLNEPASTYPHAYQWQREVFGWCAKLADAPASLGVEGEEDFDSWWRLQLQERHFNHSHMEIAHDAWQEALRQRSPSNLSREQLLEEGIRDMIKHAESRGDEYTAAYLEGCIETADELSQRSPNAEVRCKACGEPWPDYMGTGAHQCTGLSAEEVEALERPCTCHPADNPPRPCPRKYALSDCRTAQPDAPKPEVDNAIGTISSITDECIEAAQALEQLRAVKIAEAVRSIPDASETAPYFIGYDMACEEIIHRLKTEEWDMCIKPSAAMPEAPNKDCK